MERRHNMSADSPPLLIQQQQDAAAMNNLITGRRRWSRLVTESRRQQVNMSGGRSMGAGTFEFIVDQDVCEHFFSMVHAFLSSLFNERHSEPTNLSISAEADV
ncbi:unnamed protein product [Boreogadus saida]